MNKEQMEERFSQLMTEDIACELFYEYSDDCCSIEELKADGFSLKLVADVGGEGQGDECYNVVKVTHPDAKDPIHVKLDGWYASHHGAEYEEWYFVEPYQVTKTEYR